MVQSHFTSTDDGWKSVAKNNQPITSFAVCVNKNFVTTNYVTTPWTNQQFGSAECNPSNPNQEVTGGGFGFESGSTGGSYPATVQAWNATSNDESKDVSGTAYAVCSNQPYYEYQEVYVPSQNNIATCPNNYQVIGGGYVTNLGDPNLIVTLSRPTNDNSGWHVALTGDSNVKASAFAVCAIIPGGPLK